MMLWVKAFHIIAMVAWFAGLFYLPRLFVYHCQVPTTDEIGYQRFCLMERRLFWGIMTPSGIITVLLGIGLVHIMGYSFRQPPLWLEIKLALVALLIAYHIACGWMLRQFRMHKNTASTKFYRWFNEFPVLILVASVLLVILKP